MEEYHQDSFARSPDARYCSFVIAPKIKKLERKLAEEKKEGGHSAGLRLIHGLAS
jgi:hypothetical protein